MVRHYHIDPCTRDHEIYNFGRPFLGHHYYKLSLSDPCPGVRKKTFKDIHLFYTFYSSSISPLGFMEYTIFHVSFTL